MSFPLVEFENLATCETKRNLKTNLNVKGVELEHINPALGTLNGYTQLTENSSDRNIFLTGDVLFGKLRPYLKKYYFADFDGVCSTEIWVLRAKKNVSNKFLFYIVQSEFFARGVFISSGTRMPRANWDIVATTPVPLPPLDEQKRIAALLGAQDRQIEALSTLIALRQRQFRGLVQALISTPAKTGRWNMVELEEIGEVTGAGVDKKIVNGEKQVRLLNYMDVMKRNRIYSNEISHIVTAPDDKMIKCNIQKGDIFFTPSSETQGDIARSSVAMEDIPNAVYSYHIVRLRPKIKLNLDFSAYVFRQELFYHQAFILCAGSGQRYVISLSGFRSMKIPLPSAEEQERIASILGAAQRLIACLERKRELCLRRKKGLMQVLLTGKVRV